MTQYEKDILSCRIIPVVADEFSALSFDQKLMFKVENQSWLRESFLIGLQILDSLDQKGWDYNDFANILGVSEEIIMDYVSGRYKFDLTLINRLEQFLGIKFLLK